MPYSDRCRGVLYTDSISRPFTTIYIVYLSTHSIGGHGDKQKKVLKGFISLTDLDQIWHTPRRDRDESTLKISRSHIFPNSRKCEPRFFRQIFGISSASACPQNEILKSGVGLQIWAWGRVEFFDRPPRPVAAKLYYVGRPGLDRTIENRLPYNTFPPRAITLETFFPTARQIGLHFLNLEFFFDFCGPFLLTGLRITAYFLRRSIVCRAVYLTCKF